MRIPGQSTKTYAGPLIDAGEPSLADAGARGGRPDDVERILGEEQAYSILPMGRTQLKSVWFVKNVDSGNDGLAATYEILARCFVEACGVCLSPGERVYAVHPCVSGGRDDPREQLVDDPRHCGLDTEGVAASRLLESEAGPGRPFD
jgi:hypothetical protein